MLSVGGVNKTECKQPLQKLRALFFAFEREVLPEVVSDTLRS
jgi:hypothetical protein